MYIFALHTIMRDPKAEPPVVKAGEVAKLEGDELDYVLLPSVNAARPATDDEIRAAGLGVSEEKAAAEAAEREAAEKAAADKKSKKKADVDNGAEGNELLA